jgi:hypothetical protein
MTDIQKPWTLSLQLSRSLHPSASASEPNAHKYGVGTVVAFLDSRYALRSPDDLVHQSIRRSVIRIVRT